MPLIPLRINAQSERDLLTLCEQPPERLSDAYSRLAETKNSIISPRTLREVLEQSLAAGVSRALVTQLLALRTYADRYNSSIAEAVGALTLGVKGTDWTQENKTKWSIVAPIMEKFLVLDNVVTTAKALELSYDFEHLLSSANILTDIRPVYSADRSSIVGGIICNRLRLKIQEEEGFKSISISMDRDEIQRLGQICADAIKKIDLASSLLSRSGVRSFIPGEDHDDLT